MANTRFGYVRQSELDDKLLPNTFLIVRIDGHGFTKLSRHYGFEKPNDLKALQLMNQSAQLVLKSQMGSGGSNVATGQKGRGKKKQPRQGILLGFGESDEFSFLLGPQCGAFNRRASKIVTTIVSTFTAAYVHLWPHYFPNQPIHLDHLPTFDGRIVQYATSQEIIDYFKWRQADTHINNLYNTTFWSLVQQGGETSAEAHDVLKGTLSSEKQEMLFQRFGTNYNQEPIMFRRGTIVMWQVNDEQDATPRHVIEVHDDMLKDEWWHRGPGSSVFD